MVLEEKIFKCLSNQYNLYKDSLIQDYYKLLYQSFFKSEHFINDINKSYENLKIEFENILENEEEDLYQDISINETIYRINLKKAKFLKINIEDIFNLFIESRDKFEKNFDYNFENILSISKNILIKDPFKLSYNDVKNFFDKVILLKFPAVSHTRYYKSLYDPHYRVVYNKKY